MDDSWVTDVFVLVFIPDVQGESKVTAGIFFQLRANKVELATAGMPLLEAVLLLAFILFNGAVLNRAIVTFYDRVVDQHGRKALSVCDRTFPVEFKWLQEA